MVNLNIVSQAFKIHTTKKGTQEPAVVFMTDKGTEIQFTDFAGGKSIYVKLSGQAKAQEVAHWGLEKGTNEYGPIKYTLDFFRPFAEKGEAYTTVAEDFTAKVFAAAADAFESEEGKAFLASLAEARINAPAAPAPRTPHARILGIMSQARSAMRKATTADEFRAKLAESDAARAASAEGVDLDVASLNI